MSSWPVTYLFPLSSSLSPIGRYPPRERFQLKADPASLAGASGAASMLHVAGTWTSDNAIGHASGVIWDNRHTLCLDLNLIWELGCRRYFVVGLCLSTKERMDSTMSAVAPALSNASASLAMMLKKEQSTYRRCPPSHNVPREEYTDDRQLMVAWCKRLCNGCHYRQELVETVSDQPIIGRWWDTNWIELFPGL